VILGTCGHAVSLERGADTEGFAVEYRAESCDAVEGFVPCVVFATYCRACMVSLAQSEEFIAARRVGLDTETLIEPASAPDGLLAEDALAAIEARDGEYAPESEFETLHAAGGHTPDCSCEEIQLALDRRALLKHIRAL
jgi:hypothetical protein